MIILLSKTVHPKYDKEILIFLSYCSLTKYFEIISYIYRNKHNISSNNLNNKYVTQAFTNIKMYIIHL